MEAAAGSPVRHGDTRDGRRLVRTTDRTRGRPPGGCGVCCRVTGTPDGILDTLEYVNSYRTRFPKACGVGFRLGHVLEERWDAWGRGCTAGGRLPGSRAWRQSGLLWGWWHPPPGWPPRSSPPRPLIQSPLSSRQGRLCHPRNAATVMASRF